MGCDIHFFTERLTSSENYEGPKDIAVERERKLGDLLCEIKPVERWVSADRWEFEDGNWNLSYELYSSRNYNLFALLADVRNNGSIDPLSEPRGIPDDASAGYLHKSNQWDFDAHSHSYFTLEELIDAGLGTYDFTEEFLDVIESMKDIDDDPKKVRCCFFFDN